MATATTRTSTPTAAAPDPPAAPAPAGDRPRPYRRTVAVDVDVRPVASGVLGVRSPAFPGTARLVFPMAQAQGPGRGNSRAERNP